MDLIEEDKRTLLRSFIFLINKIPNNSCNETKYNTQYSWKDEC